MNEQFAQDPDQESAELSEQAQQRRDFLCGLGKWSSASAMAAIGSAAWLSAPRTASAGAWINRRGGGGRWANLGGGGGAWVNRRRGGGAWANRR